MSERERPAVPDEIWTAEQVAAYCKVTERTLRDWRDRDVTFPPPLDLPGRALRWQVEDIVSWTMSLRGGAAEVARQLRRQATPERRDPGKTLVTTEIELWLDPANHRSRGNKP